MMNQGFVRVSKDYGPKELSLIDKAGLGVANFLILDDLKTITDPDSSFMAKGLSMASITPFGPAIKAGNAGIRLVRKSSIVKWISPKKVEKVSGTATGNTVSDYLDDIIVKGNADAAKLTKLKNAIQNNTFSVDELSEIRKKMSDLGITKEYDEALIKIDFGKYLRGLIGDPPVDMVDSHAHHILFKKGLGEAQQKLVQEGQEILRKYGIEPIIGKENLVWAPNRIAGQHNISALENVVNQLKAVDAAGADLDDIIEILEDLGKQAASR
ncbi:hypothetical protein [Sporosarcina sp. SG10008]|uniref:hypothetical protein n=1 Tax=Sporosarcina sp. SG10008 TaxID=3373103 RepID=UPI0037DCC15E